MASLNINLSDELKGFIEIRVQSGDFETAADYLSHLIVNDKEQSVDLNLKNALMAAVNSGAAVKLKASNWRYIRAAVKSRIGLDH